MIPQHQTALASAEGLLNRYHSGNCFFLSSPQGTLLTEGELAVVTGEEQQFQASLVSQKVKIIWEELKRSGYDNPMIVGAVPFAPGKPARLIVPEKVFWEDRTQMDADAGSGDQQSPGTVLKLEEEPSPADYMDGVERALGKIRAGELSKVVLSRTLRLTAAADVDPAQLLRQLAANRSGSYTFAVDLPHATLIGASPELLVSRRGKMMITNPLAGSAARSADPVEDQRRAASLLTSGKDLHEHAVVVEGIVEALRPFCRTLEAPERPSLIQTPTMWHLSSEIKGELLDPAITSLDLAAALHPTPAVCGAPTEAAREAIEEIEPFDRGFYTGMVGWCDSRGDGEWIVTIRCAEVSGRDLRLFAGAGIVEGSEAAAELQETSAKFRTMLHAMGLDN
ncbi:isochorismate synthase DhbC [Paenibacillus sambharensis]|uniref:isochorismate synthase n=1 Tax=Paenibacillus sambharensis TaxID=1803190 RepID=A0A2W1LKA8_9BACL|nr:isochorismate synthase DhbC [Paenibacillus sambharensis]PZD95335.1 isochorismate synthase DhbC [Paenibacillus sambharensis]